MLFRSRSHVPGGESLLRFGGIPAEKTHESARTEPAGSQSLHANLYKNMRPEYFRAKDDVRFSEQRQTSAQKFPRAPELSIESFISGSDMIPDGPRSLHSSQASAMRISTASGSTLPTRTKKRWPG